MTALAPPAVDTAHEPPDHKGTGAPGALWVAGIVVIVPAVTPIAYLLWSVMRPGGIDAGGIPLPRLIQLLGSTALLVVAVTALSLALGTATAWLTTRTDLAGRRAWSTLVTVPLVIPSYVGALALLGASGNGGLLTRIAETFGLPGVPVLSGFWPTWAALSLWNFSYVHLLAVPALRRMDPALEEAAQGLGSSRRRTLRTVVIPQLRPALLSGSLLVGLYVLSDFGAVSLLRYETFTRAIYTQFRGRLDVSPALFLSGVLVLVALGLVVAEQRSRGRAALHAGRSARRPSRTHLGGWQRRAAYAFLTVVVAGALVLPMVTLGWWAWRGLTLGNVASSVVPEMIRSATVSGLAAAITVIAALPLAVLTVRHASRRTGLLEAVAWSTYSLPHLAVGLGFLVLAVRFVPAIYQTVTLLVIAYVAMFLPQAMAATQTGLRQIGPHLEEASRSLGVGPARTAWKVTIPLLTRSLVAGAALVFLTAMKELPATLLLRPTGFETLAVRIWSASTELFYTQASVAALVLVAISALPLYLLVARDLHDS